MLHPLAQDGVFRIVADFDRETLLDFFVRFHGRIRELDAVASRERRRPCAQDDIDRLDLPLIVGKTVLRRPSAAAMQWLRTCASAWWGESKRVYGFALAFACANRSEEAFLPMRSRVRASILIWRWVLGVHASEEALRRAANSLLPLPDDSIRWFVSPEDAAADNSEPDLMEIALAISRRSGKTPAHWLFEVSDDDFWGEAMSLRDEAEVHVDRDKDSECWWRRHRRALARCENKLEVDAAAWLKARNHKDATAEAPHV